jgi:hypothetical protein
MPFLFPPLSVSVPAVLPPKCWPGYVWENLPLFYSHRTRLFLCVPGRTNDSRGENGTSGGQKTPPPAPVSKIGKCSAKPRFNNRVAVPVGRSPEYSIEPDPIYALNRLRDERDDRFIFPGSGSEVSGVVEFLSRKIHNRTTKSSGMRVQYIYPLWYTCRQPQLFDFSFLARIPTSGKFATKSMCCYWQHRRIDTSAQLEKNKQRKPWGLQPSKSKD